MGKGGNEWRREITPQDWAAKLLLITAEEDKILNIAPSTFVAQPNRSRSVEQNYRC